MIERFFYETLDDELAKRGFFIATDYAPDGVRPRFDVAICTVSSTVAQSLSIAPQNGYRGYRLMIKSRTNADGTVTFVACFTRRAMTVSFR